MFIILFVLTVFFFWGGITKVSEVEWATAGKRSKNVYKAAAKYIFFRVFLINIFQKNTHTAAASKQSRANATWKKLLVFFFSMGSLQIKIVLIFVLVKSCKYKEQAEIEDIESDI